MTFRIGGEIEIALDSLAAPQLDVPPLLSKPYIARLNSGRSALYLALLEIVRRGGTRRAWVPAYVCASVVAAFKALDFELNFYSMGSRLSAPEFLPKVASGGTFLYVHYFGRKNNAAIEWLGQQNYSGNFFVIEDCVQASLNSDVGSAGDYAIKSYRKFLPQPDGALLGAELPIQGELHEADEAFVSAKFTGKLLRQQPENAQLYLALFGEAENRLEQEFIPRRMSWLSEYLMKRTDIGAISQTRRENWLALSELLEENFCAGKRLVPIFGGLSEGEVPLGLPVIIHGGKRDALRQYLASRQIFCPVHWELPHLQGGDEWRAEIEMSGSILTLPIDQRLDEEHLNYMAQAIETFFDGNS